MKFVKLIALFLVMASLLSVLVACHNGGEGQQQGTTEGNGADTSDDLYDANGYLKDQLPNDIDYGNKEVNIVAWQNHFGEFDPDISSTDQVDMAVYERNASVEERFGVELIYTIIPGDNNTQGDFVAAVENNLLTGDTVFDLVAAYSMSTMTMAADGVLENLIDCEYLDFDNPWWPKTLTSQATINGKLYGASGDIAVSYYYSMFLIVMNKSVWTNYSLEGDVVEDVKSGQWTIEKMLTYAQNVYEDKNSNGKDASDNYGLIFDHSVPFDMFISGSNMKFVKQTDNGKIQLGDDIMDISKGDAIITKLATALQNDYAYYGNKTDLSKALIRGQALFYPCSISKLGTDIADGINYEYYILPTPKYDTNQDHYYTNVGFTYTMYSIPKNGKVTDMPALLMEALASAGYRTSTDVLYEKKIKYQYSNEAFNMEMFELIRSYPYFEISRFSYQLFEQRKMNPISIFRTCVTSYGTAGANWSSKISSIKKMLSYYLENDLTSAFETKE